MFEKVFREARKLTENQGELQQFALREAWRLLRSGRVKSPPLEVAQKPVPQARLVVEVVERGLPESSMGEVAISSLHLRPEYVVLSTGAAVRNIPANLDIKMGEALKTNRVKF